jgi:hypothetical protein
MLWPTIWKTIVGLVFTGVLGVIMWPFRKAKKEMVELKSIIIDTHKELVEQRTNCLSTLQSQGESQVKLLEKAVEVLGDMRMDLAKQTGYLEAISLVPKRKVYARK